MKKALIFDQYLNTLGGGERYSLTFAAKLVERGYKVEIAWADPSTLKEAEKRFGINLSSLQTSRAAYEICNYRVSIFKKYNFLKKYDLVFWVSDGSLPFLFGKNNLVHFQVPFKILGGNPLMNNLKSCFINKFVYNSVFTKNVLEKSLTPKKSFVLYPPIDIDSLVSEKKENLILSVARFGSTMTSKRQDLLIEAFRIFSVKFPNYKLILTGGVMPNSTDIVSLKTQSVGLNVEIITNPDFTTLKNLYSKSRFFWHAAGFGVDEKSEPGKVEHFGMTTVEAMASGCIPLVIAKGGQNEIITSGTGYLCNSAEEISQKTADLANDEKTQTKIRDQAKLRSQEFSTQKFNEKISFIVK